MSKGLPSIAVLRKRATEHLAQCGGDVADHDERWRMRFLRMQNVLVRKQDEGLETLTSKLEDVLVEMRSRGGQDHGPRG